MSFFCTVLVIGVAAGMENVGIVKDGAFCCAGFFSVAAVFCSAAFFLGAPSFTLAILAVASSSPVAITVILAVSTAVSSYIAPKIMLASSPARSCT